MADITVYIVPNPLEPARREQYQVRALVPWLVERYGTWPATARLCHVWGSLEADVTPICRADVAALEDLPGPFVVREQPAGVAIIVGIGIAVVIAAVAAAVLIPEVPTIRAPAQRAQQKSSGSPNNDLGERSNRARPEERIPDIYGTVRSIPDLLMQPYSVYVDHRQQEIGYYCITRGPADVLALRDGPQLIGTIEGASAHVYAPGNAPTGGPGLHTPYISVGDPIDDDVYTVHRVGAVNGQELRAAFHDFTFYSTRFRSDQGEDAAPIVMFIEDLGGGEGSIGLPYSTAPEEITDRVSVGDQLYVYWPMQFLPAGTGTAPDLGTPALTSVFPYEGAFLTVLEIVADNARVYLRVSIPVGQQAQWALLATYFGVPNASFFFAQFTNVSRAYVGPLFSDFQHPLGFSGFELICNFVAPNGSYQDDGTTPLPLDREIFVLVTPADVSGNPVAATQVFQGTLSGSAVARGQRALTLRCRPTGMGANTRCLVRAYLPASVRRERQHDSVEIGQYHADLSDPANPHVSYYAGRIVDEVRWVDCYSISTPPQISFGNVTTVHTRTIATDGATRIRERQLNCVATRKIQTWNGVSFGGAALPSGRVYNILFSVLKDANIGNLPDSAIDFAGIVAAFDTVDAKVFDTSPLSTSFAHTFDDADLSLEETVQAICQACFAIAYREGPVIKVRPEVAHDDSVLVLNHRNVIRGSQRITHGFGAPTENDSVECVWLDPFAGTSEKVAVPINGTRLRPRQLNLVGLQYEEQAYWHAYRAYFKMLYQRQSMTLEATQEAGLLRLLERVLVADLTSSSGVQDGEVLAASGTAIQTSQPVALTLGKTYTLYLQAPDGSVQERAVTASTGTFKLTLASAPSPVPITDAATGVRTTYLLVADDQATPRAYLVSGSTPTPDLTHEVTAVNYSHLYYFADGLQTWVIFTSVSDLSPMQHTFQRFGTSVVSGGLWTAAAAGLAYFEDVTTDPATPSYTKTLRINADTPVASRLIGSGNDTSELFILEFDQHLYGGHGGSYQVGVDYSTLLGSEHDVALTYEAVTQRMALFVDGVLVDEATVTPSAGTGHTRYLDTFAGSCRRLARWGRALSDREIQELHLRGM